MSQRYDGWLRLASSLGMTLSDCMRGHTQRQYRVWMCWLDEQWNRPNRTDNYLMQIAAEVRRGYVSKPETIDNRKFKIDFTLVSAKPLDMTPEDEQRIIEQTKAIWLGIAGSTPGEHRVKQ